MTSRIISAAMSRNVSVQDSAGVPLSNTFRQTQGGRSGPYKAAAFDLTPCGDLPSLDAVGDMTQASEILNAYLVRVGNNGTCFWDPNFQGLCDPPLTAATEYRWVSVAVGRWKTQEGDKMGEATLLRAFAQGSGVSEGGLPDLQQVPRDPTGLCLSSCSANSLKSILSSISSFLLTSLLPSFPPSLLPSLPFSSSPPLLL